MLSRLLTRREQVVIVFFAAAAIIGAATIYGTRTPGEGPAGAIVLESRPEARDRPIATQVVSERAEVDSQVEAIRDEVTVSVVGAVGRPGVYTLDAGSRVQDLIGSAGGLLRSADTSDVNLAAKLVDATTLDIPRKGVQDELGVDIESDSGNISAYTISGRGTGSSGDAVAVLGTSGSLIDLNRATQAELESLPGIGPMLAGEIIRCRRDTRFSAVSDVMNVSGIGQKRYEAIAGLVIVR